LRNFLVPDHAYASQVSAVFALGSVMFSLRVKLPDSPLHESHIGTIFSPVTLGLMICAPKVGVLKQPETEHVAGHDLPE
jgi:hypothetical protein